MAKDRDPKTGLLIRVQAGRHFTEADLASAAAALLKNKDVTQTEAASKLGMKTPQNVSMALSLVAGPDAAAPWELRYPNRGHGIRRAILRLWGGFAFDGDGPDPVAGPHHDAPMFTRVSTQTAPLYVRSGVKPK